MRFAGLGLNVCITNGNFLIEFLGFDLCKLSFSVFFLVIMIMITMIIMADVCKLFDCVSVVSVRSITICLMPSPISNQ